MAGSLPVTTWDPLQYCSPEELSRLDKRFDHALRDVTCLLFWTGVPPELAQRWAAQHELPTLTIAMGSLYSARDADGARYGKSPKAWSKYMKGASTRFAEYACRGNRQAVVLTQPPPNIYSIRKRSNYRQLEEPILKGVSGGPGTAQINYVHPTVMGAAAFPYQIWPLDRSSAWYTFFSGLLLQGAIIRDMSGIPAEGEVVVGTDQICRVVVQVKEGKLADKKQAKVQEKEKKAELERQMAREKTETSRKLAELGQGAAQQKKEAKRKKAKLKRQRSKSNKEIKRKRVELEQQKAREKTETKRKKAELEQRAAQGKKEAKRKKAELEQRAAQEKKEAKRKRVELEQQKGRERKKGTGKKVEGANRKMM